MTSEDSTLSGLTPRLSLLLLPAELRIQIWKCTLGGMVFDVYSWPSCDVKKISTRILNRQKNFLSLLRACHQIYSEARLLPFKTNAFRIKNEDGIPAFIDKFKVIEREAIAELHLVTLGVKYMAESLSYFPKSMPAMLVLQRLPGLRKLCIEVRTKSYCRYCSLGYCNSCIPDLEFVEKNLMEHVAKESSRVEVMFRHTFYASLAAARVF
jgi:hypothetical protein